VNKPKTEKKSGTPKYSPVMKLGASYKNSLFRTFYLKFTPFEKLVASAQKNEGKAPQI
jgi:hypothetical protein